MLERIENTILRYNMLPAGIRLGVAVSGGADSVFLLRYLAERGGTALTALHVNHGLRGAASEDDEDFVRGLAAELGVDVRVHRMAGFAGNLEQACRRERISFFGRVMGEGLVDRVATGHTASDQAETVLMRLLRGAGTTGLRGVLPVTREGLVRPLLGVRREEIRAWLGERGLGWREDASNDSDQFLRNRVRRMGLPALRALDVGVDAALERVAELAAVDEDYWRREAGAVMARAGRTVRGGVVLDRRELAGLHAALLGRVAREAMERATGSLRRVDREHVERLAELLTQASGEGRTEFPGGVAVRSMDWVRVGREEEAGCAEVELSVPGGGEIGEYRVEVLLGGYTDGIATLLDWERLRPPLRLRTWRAGDRFRLPGREPERMVKELFERARVPSWDRQKWPMISDSDGIVWIQGFGAAAGREAHAGTRRPLQVRCDTVSSK